MCGAMNTKNRTNRQTHTFWGVSSTSGNNRSIACITYLSNSIAFIPAFQFVPQVQGNVRISLVCPCFANRSWVSQIERSIYESSIFATNVLFVIFAFSCILQIVYVSQIVLRTST